MAVQLKRVITANFFRPVSEVALSRHGSIVDKKNYRAVGVHLTECLIYVKETQFEYAVEPMDDECNEVAQANSGTRPEALSPGLLYRLIPNPRFGQHGYAWEQPPSYPVKQISLTTLPVPADMTQPLALKAADAADLGYSSYVVTADCKVSQLMPHAQGAFLHPLDAINFRGDGQALPQTMRASIVPIPDAAGGFNTDYVAFDLLHIDATTGSAIVNTQYVPFGTYKESDGEIVGIAWCDAQTAYRFSVNPRALPLTAGNRQGTITLASEEDIRKYGHFQRLLVNVPLSPIAGSSKLRHEAQDVKIKFNTVFMRSETLLNAAVTMMEHQQPVVMQLCARLLGTQPNNMKLLMLFNSLSQRLIQMQKFLPFLKAQSANAIGFSNIAPDASGTLTLAAALENAMSEELDYSDLPNGVLLVFDRNTLMNVPIDDSAATLLHEASHAVFGTVDKMGLTDTGGIYAYRYQDRMILTEITRAAQLLDSRPEQHAATFEHMVMMMAYLANGVTSELVMPYLRDQNHQGYALLQ